MSDPSFTNEFFKDSSLSIKQEPSPTDELNLMNVTGCVPIPSRRLDLSQIRDCGLVDHVVQAAGVAGARNGGVAR